MKQIPFDIRPVLDFDDATINTGVQEATRFLNNLSESIKETRQYASMLTGLFAAVFASLTGILAGTAGAASVSTQTILIAGMAANALPVIMLLRGLFYNRKIQYGGAQPIAYFRQEAVKWVQDMKEWNTEAFSQDKYFKLLHLQSLQVRINENIETQKSLVRWYRLALHCAVAAYSAVVVLIIVFALIGM